MASPYGALARARQIRPYPAASLNGEVNAFLTNNVLYSHLTKDLTNTVRVRYYDRKDNTPTLAFTNYVYADSGLATTQPLTREPHSYSRLNIEDDLKWQANRAWTFGVGYFFERYVYENGEVDATNESGAQGLRQLDTVELAHRALFGAILAAPLRQLACSTHRRRRTAMRNFLCRIATRPRRTESSRSRSPRTSPSARTAACAGMNIRPMR